MAAENELIPSPCIRNCCLNDDDICLGCFRSLAEVIAWADSDNSERSQILENTKNRRQIYLKRIKAC